MEKRRYRVDEFGHTFPISDRPPDEGSGDYWGGLKVRHADAGRATTRATFQTSTTPATPEAKGDQTTNQDSQDKAPVTK